MDDFFRNDAVEGKVWSISKGEAKVLHNNALESKRNPGEYNLFGLEALLPKSAAFSQALSGRSATSGSAAIKTVVGATSGRRAEAMAREALSPPGHNCFTWARWQLFQIENKMLQNELPHRWSDMLASITSRHLQSSASSSGQNATPSNFYFS